MANICSGNVNIQSSNDDFLYEIQEFLLADLNAFGIEEDDPPTVFSGDYINFQFEVDWSGSGIFDHFVASMKAMLDKKPEFKTDYLESKIIGEARETGCCYHEQIKKKSGSEDIDCSLLYPSDITFFDAVHQAGLMDLSEGDSAILGQLVSCRCVKHDGKSSELEIDFQCQSVKLDIECKPDGGIISYSDDGGESDPQESDYFGEMVDDMLSGEPIEIGGEKWW